MNVKKALETIGAAEKAGLRIVVNGMQWDGPVATFPLDPNVSPLVCELVAEARHIAGRLERPDTPPEGSVYRHPKATLEAALIRAAEHIEAKMKGKTDAQRIEAVAEGDEQPAAGGPVKGGSGGADRAGGGKASGGGGGEGDRG